MQRFTISLDDELASQFDRLSSQRGYVTRSEAVRDLIRERLGSTLLGSSKATWCVASVIYVYASREAATVGRLMELQHQHHDLVVSVQRTPLDHDNCLETVVLRGPAVAVQACAGLMTALRGVRNGQVHAVALAEEPHSHRHSHAAPKPHRHFTPVT